MNSPKFSKNVLSFVCGCLLIAASGCGALQNPVVEPFYGGKSAPPAAQEFRWSNGASLPKNFDPARASAAPETDVARALFEGLTDADARTLQPVPAIAVRWEASEDFRTWTFFLRPNVKWSNGKPVTAKDFARSWKRAAKLGEETANFKLLANIVGAKTIQSPKYKVQSPIDESNISKPESENPKTDIQIVKDRETKDDGQKLKGAAQIGNPEFWFGAEAVSDTVLRVFLVEPDKDFPALAAHPAFRPVWADGADLATTETGAKIITNGAFRFVSIDKNNLILERDSNYWNAGNVKLDRIRFVPQLDAESALAAYRGGELDAVTNAGFEPLAVKLLASYQDFRRTTYNALNFYEFNQKHPPFSDKRIREALAIAIDRERLVQDETDGAGVAATGFSPNSGSRKIVFDAERAKTILAEAGFENGKNFPKIRLLINRNEMQRRIARFVAQQWRRHLNVETEIVVSSQADFDRAFIADDFDIVRRGEVLGTIDETANLATLFDKSSQEAVIKIDESPQIAAPSPTVSASPTPIASLSEPEHLPSADESVALKHENPPENSAQPETAENESNAAETVHGADAESNSPILTEAQAIEELPAIPLYFPSSFALVKPYVSGFEPNLLDAPSLKDVRIETNWRQQ